MAGARELILAAMERNEITWPDVLARVQRDEDVSPPVALELVRHAQESFSMPLVVAAAIITLISDKRSER